MSAASSPSPPPPASPPVDDDDSNEGAVHRTKKSPAPSKILPRPKTSNGIPLCGRFSRKGSCRFGNQCRYAHGMEDTERPLTLTSSKATITEESQQQHDYIQIVACTACDGTQGARAVVACNTCYSAVCVRCATRCTGCISQNPLYNPIVYATKSIGCPTNVSDASLYVSSWCPEHAQRTAQYTCTWCNERMCSQCSNGRVEMHHVCIAQRIHSEEPKLVGNGAKFTEWYRRLATEREDSK